MTVQGPVKKLQPDRMSHRGGGGFAGIPRHTPPPRPPKRLGQVFASAPSAQLIHVIACFVLYTAFLVLRLLPPSVCCILGGSLYYSYGIPVHAVEEACNFPSMVKVGCSNRKRVMDSLKEWCRRCGMFTSLRGDAIASYG